MSAAIDPAKHARELLDQGFSVFPRVWADAEVERLRDAISACLAATAPPRLWSERDVRLGDGVVINYTGVVFYRLLMEHPEITELVLNPSVVESLRGALGRDMRLEIVGGVATDETRPFFHWHTHIGGFDDGKYQSHGGWPQITTAQRVTTLLYLDDIDEDGGLFLVYPRAVGDPTAPPQDPASWPWQGQVEIRVPKGSLVAIEQCTWHTALPMRRPGLRMFLGSSFRAEGVPAPAWVDPELAELARRCPLIASVVA